MMTRWTRHFVSIIPNPYNSSAKSKYHLLHHISSYFPQEKAKAQKVK